MATSPLLGASVPGRSSRHRPLYRIFDLIGGGGARLTPFSVHPLGNGEEKFVSVVIGGGGGRTRPGKGGDAGGENQASTEVATNHEAESSNSKGNINGEVEKTRLHDKYILLNTPPESMCGTATYIPAHKDNKLRMKGFLASTSTSATNLLGACVVWFIFSFGYPLSIKARLSFDDTIMQVIIIISAIAALASFVLSHLASGLKDSKSIEGADFQIVKWLQLSVLVLLLITTCLLLSFAANIPNSVVCPFGVISGLAIVVIWIWWFYFKHPKILKSIKEDSVGEDGKLLIKFESNLPMPPV